MTAVSDIGLMIFGWAFCVEVSACGWRIGEWLVEAIRHHSRGKIGA